MKRKEIEKRDRDEHRDWKEREKEREVEKEKERHREAKQEGYRLVERECMEDVWKIIEIQRGEMRENEREKRNWERMR